MRTYKAFVSSTYIDLKNHRAYVIDSLRKAGFHVDPMEDWTADPDEPKAFSRERVDGCDICILLVARRRGHRPDGETKSITQMEYDHALEKGIDVLPFLLDEKAPWQGDYDEVDKDPALAEWRGELQEHHGVGFFVVEPQTIQIHPALIRWVQKKKEVEGPDISYWLGRPASLGSGFVGREKDIEALSSAFSGHGAGVVSGGAGTGKSRLAAEYAHRCGFDGFWTGAGATVAQTLAALAPALDVEVEGRSDEEIAAQVQTHLAGLSSDTLWVVDNLADLGLVNDLLNAPGPIELLITTRDARRQLLPPQVAFAPLTELEPDPAIELLCSRSDCDPKDPALPEIAEAVGRLPLALEVLAVRLGEPPQTPEKMLAELRQAPTAVELRAFQDAEGTTIDPEGVLKTITGSLAALPRDIRDQIAPLGYLADAPVPQPLVAALTGLEEEGVGKLLAQCSRQSVLTIREGQVVVHALTAAAIAATNEDAVLRTAVARAWPRLTAINEADPIALRAELTHHDQIHGHAKQLIGTEDASALNLAICLAIAYGTAGRLADGIRLDEETLAARERVLGPDHRDTLLSRNNLAASYANAGRAEEAIRLHERTLAARVGLLGAGHPDTLNTRVGLAMAYRGVGRWEEALRLDEEALAARERLLGPDHPRTLDTRVALANDYRAAGRTAEAIGLDEETLAARERVLGPDHPYTLINRSNLASGYRAVGRIEEAIGLDEETLAARERVLGRDHPKTLLTRGNLAFLYRAAGRDEDALRLYEETLAARERVLGPVHPDTLHTRNNLAIAYRAAGRDEDADRLEGKSSGKSKPKRKRRGGRQE